MKATPVLVGLAILCLAFAIPARADQRFYATLTGGQQVPAVASSGTGVGTVVLNTAETQILVNMSFSGLSSAATAAHIHGPAAAGANAGVLFGLAGVTAATSGSIPEQVIPINAEQVTQLKAGQFYFNINTTNFGGGERAWDTWRSAMANPNSVEAKLQARFNACSTQISRASFDTYQ